MSILPEQLQKELFINKKSVSQIASEYGYTTKSLYGLMSRWGIKKPFKYSINTEKLFNPKDPVTNYLAGLIATDGYLHPKHQRIDIHLVGLSEKQLLENLMNYYESDIPVKQYKYEYNEKGKFGVGITAEGIREFFIDNFGLTLENKTETVGIPKAFNDENCARMYIRGCFDGDGSFNPNIPRLTISMKSERFITGVRDIIDEYLGIRVSIDTSNGYPSLYYQHSNPNQIQSWFYQGYETIRLERKYQKFLEYQNSLCR
jgi:DNA-binding transcriptional regulator WhiA